MSATGHEDDGLAEGGDDGLAEGGVEERGCTAGEAAERRRPRVVAAAGTGTGGGCAITPSYCKIFHERLTKLIVTCDQATQIHKQRMYQQ